MEISKALESAANSDMRFVRKQGSILIARTQKGTVSFSYDAVARTYAIVQQGFMPEADRFRRVDMKAAECVECLKSIYTVEV